jgi:hypothetical protein
MHACRPHRFCQPPSRIFCSLRPMHTPRSATTWGPQLDGPAQAEADQPMSVLSQPFVVLITSPRTAQAAFLVGPSLNMAYARSCGRRRDPSLLSKKKERPKSNSCREIHITQNIRALLHCCWLLRNKFRLVW